MRKTLMIIFMCFLCTSVAFAWSRVYSGKQFVDLNIGTKTTTQKWILKRGTTTIKTYDYSESGAKYYSDLHGTPNSYVSYSLEIYEKDGSNNDYYKTEWTFPALDTSVEYGDIYNGSERTRYEGSGAVSNISYESGNYTLSNVAVRSGELRISNADLDLANGILYVYGGGYITAAGSVFSGPSQSSASLNLGQITDEASASYEASYFADCTFNYMEVYLLQPVSTFNNNTLAYSYVSFDGISDTVHTGLNITGLVISTDNSGITFSHVHSSAVTGVNSGREKLGYIDVNGTSSGITVSDSKLTYIEAAGAGHTITGNTVSYIDTNGLAGTSVDDNTVYQYILLSEITGAGVSVTGNSVQCTETADIKGIRVQQSSADFEIKENTVDGCDLGIFVNNSSNVTIEDNTVKNSEDVGIYLAGAKDCTLYGNTVTDNGTGSTAAAYLTDAGILLDASQNDVAYASTGNAVAYNTITGTNGYGIVVGYRSAGNNDNGFHENVVRGNTKTGLWFYRGTGNIAYNNSFEDNGGASLYNVADATNLNQWYQAKQSVDSNIIGGVYLGGNYYDDYTGADADGDGLGDTAYNIPGGGGAQDIRPLVYAQETVTHNLIVTVTGIGHITSYPAGIDCGDGGGDCQAAYAENTEVTLTAAGRARASVFVRWTGACSGTEPTATVSMSAYKTCGAVFETSDSDGDGIDDSIDLNGDSDTAEVEKPGVTGSVLLQTEDEGYTFSDVVFIDDGDSTLNSIGKPDDYEFTYGLVSFKVNNVTAGSTVLVTLTYPAELENGFKVYKYSGAGFRAFEVTGNDRYELGADGKTLYLYITDGGPNDDDGTSDGVITDPVGVGEPAAESGGETSASSGGGGCSASGTGSPVMLLMMLGGYAIFRLRRKI